MQIQIPRGTYDVLPVDAFAWQKIEKTAREVCALFNYKEMRTPIFESTNLFQRGVGDTTDIVQKEMYNFKDRGGRDLTLRPEGTASFVRAYVEHKLFGLPSQPQKLYYIGPMFRYERPQAGRMRQFTQFGAEALGSADPSIDAEVIALAMTFYQKLGLKSLNLVLNSLGDPESRAAHRDALIAHFKPSIGEFCEDCQNRLEKNPLRILDCKEDHDHPLMATAPSIIDYLNEESREYFAKVKAILDEMGIAYELDPTLVRGLDYYNHTTFEIMGASKGAITTLMGGGRYNGLVSELGGPETPGIGFALSIERLLLALEVEGVQLSAAPSLDCFIVAIGEKAENKAPVLLNQLRQSGLYADKDYMERKVKGQFKQADRDHAKFVVVIGDEELEAQKAVVKNMADGTQEDVAFASLTDYLKEKLTTIDGVK
ncbi:histidine--tRNA ligase [Sporolactobacillus laevolacticus]|uniref:Histidine--tRNA ligase n=1 Tax=Sporolactobacillus laevolacticus DSM 442 TaxID=1395513 RepID=V6J0I7_9BACL|nr:histidine--tRNA ligase [Sporolactobacillus laevolacticus]EST13423.1 histidyl-tRNA synthetase [Sporolactobacillus laevolacticus DSM 442]